MTSDPPTLKQKLTERCAALLRSAERFTSTDLRRHAKGWVWLMSGQTAGVATALLLAIGYAHFLSKESYGTYKYALSIFNTLGVLAMPGMDTAAQRGVARGKEGIFWHTFKKRIQGGLLAGAISLSIGVYYITHDHTTLAAIFIAAAPFLVFIDSLTHYNSLLMGRQQFKHLTIYGIVLQVVASFIIFATVVLTENALFVVLSYLAGYTAIRALILLHLVRTAPPNKLADKSEIAYGTHMTVINFLGIGSSNLDAILLWHFLGPVPLAVYSFAQAASDQLRKAFKLITTAMAFPRFAAQDKEVLKKTLGRKILLVHLATVPMAILFIFLIPFLYHWVFPAYVDSIPYAQAMVGLLAFSPVRFYSTALSAHASTKALYTLGITQSILQTILYLMMIPLFGIWGVILAVAIQQFISNIVGFRLFHRM